MEPIDLARELGAIRARAPGSDSERRAALLLRDRLAALGRAPAVETLWVRPNAAAAAAWATLLGIAGSLLSVAEPRAGLAALLVVLVAFAAELTGIRARPLRLLTRERATQNVLAPPPPRDGEQPALTLTLVAGCDAPPRGRGLARPLQAAAAGLWPSARAWLGAALLALVVLAGMRALGQDGRGVGAAQLVTTVALLAALLVLAEIALAPAADGEREAAAAAVAVTLAAALDAAPPRALAVEVLIAGAASADAAGAERWVRSRRRGVRREDVAVLAIEPCGAGPPAWRRSDGPLVRLRAHPQLLALCDRVAREEPSLGARAIAGRGTSLSLPARRAGWASIAVQSAPSAGAAKPGAPADPDAGAPAATLEFCLALVGALDDELSRSATARAPAGAAAG